MDQCYNFIEQSDMSIDDAMQQMLEIIMSTCGSAEVRVAKMSDEEARLSVYAPAGDMQIIKDATFIPAIDLLNKDGLDIQVFVYDKYASPLKG
jgi:hypothetical protein